MTDAQKKYKRLFDIILAMIGLIFFGWMILILLIFARLDTQLSGIFAQKRVGQHGQIFKIYKIRTMRKLIGVNTNVTTINDLRITRFGLFLRRTKLDELPQLWNILIGDMSFVGPRPDVPGFADELKGLDRTILKLKPGITGPASIYFKNEEILLSKQSKPEEYNKQVVWPKKVAINRSYYQDYSILDDFKYLIKTIFNLI